MGYSVQRLSTDDNDGNQDHVSIRNHEHIINEYIIGWINR